MRNGLYLITLLIMIASNSRAQSVSPKDAESLMQDMENAQAEILDLEKQEKAVLSEIETLKKKLSNIQEAKFNQTKRVREINTIIAQANREVQIKEINTTGASVDSNDHDAYEIVRNLMSLQELMAKWQQMEDSDFSEQARSPYRQPENLISRKDALNQMIRAIIRIEKALGSISWSNKIFTNKKFFEILSSVEISGAKLSDSRDVGALKWRLAYAIRSVIVDLSYTLKLKKETHEMVRASVGRGVRSFVDEAAKVEELQACEARLLDIR